MANTPPAFPYLVGALDPDQNQEIAGGFAYPGPNNLPLETTATNRYWPLYDVTTRQIRMWKSTDSGVTWAQFDSASAPVSPANGTGAQPKIWEYNNAAYKNRGPIITSVLNAGGAGYAVGDTGTVDGGSTSATYIIDSVDGGGAVLTFHLTGVGTEYLVASGVTTATGGAQPGAGVGFTVDLTAIAGTIYVVCFDASFNLTLVPFDISTDTWGSAVASGLTYLDNSFAFPRGVGGLMIAWRPNDDRVWVAFMAGGQDATDFGTLWYASCQPNGAGWDGSLTRLGGSYQDGVYHTTGSFACDEATGDIHAAYTRWVFGFGGNLQSVVTAHVVTSQTLTNGGAGYPAPSFVSGTTTWTVTGSPITGGSITGFAPSAVGNPDARPDGTYNQAITGKFGRSTVVHRVIKADNSLTAEETIFDDAAELKNINNISNLKVGDGVMSVCFLTGGITLANGGILDVARAVIGDAPGWEITTPSPPNSLPDIHQALGTMETMRAGGIDYLFFGYNPSSGTHKYSYLTSTGIGAGWSAEVNFATAIDTATFYGVSVVCPLLPISKHLAIGLFAGDDWGDGYWELIMTLACAYGIASVGVPYSSLLVVTGGTGPYTYAIIAGSLPPGLTLNPATGAITGTPTTPGTYPYTAEVTDSLGATATASCSIGVRPVVTGWLPQFTKSVTRAQA